MIHTNHIPCQESCNGDVTGRLVSSNQVTSIPGFNSWQGSKSLSQSPHEAQTRTASHCPNETHFALVSQRHNEIHCIFVSHDAFKTQKTNAFLNT